MDINETLGQVKAVEEKCVATLAEAKSLRDANSAELKAMRDQLADARNELKALRDQVETAEAKAKAAATAGPARRKTLGAAVINSPQFKAYSEGVVTGSTGRIELGRLAEYEGYSRKSVSGSSNLRDVLSTQLQQTIYADPLPGISDRIRDYMPVIPTTFAQIHFCREDLFTNAAAPTAEGAQKPESSISFSNESENVVTIPHFMPVTRQLLSDISGLEAHINLRLLEGLKLKENQQILYGAGNTELRGLVNNTVGVQTYSWSDGEVGDTMLDAIRRAYTLAMIAEYPVTGLIMHHNDWAKIELLKGNDGHYVFANVATGGNPVLWRIPVIPTSTIAEGTALMGAFAMGAALHEKEGANIRISEHHEDFFTKNLIAILAEQRLALTCYRPKSFIVITFDSAPAS